MQNTETERLDRVFHALSDATRRKILLQIAQSEMRVTDIATSYEMSLNAVSKHLKVLEGAGLLKRTVDGRVHRCLMNAEPLTEASEVIRHYQAFWNKQLDALEEFLSKAADPNDVTKSPKEKKS